MGLSQYLRIVWARKWLALGVFILIAAGGITYVLMQPRQYVAETSLIVDLRIDPALGALAPALAAPSYMATQIEILRSERVASRAVKLLGVERSPVAVAQWREQTQAKIPLERYYAGVLQKGLTVEPARGSNLINLWFSSPDPIFAQAAANAFAQSYMDVSVDLRVAPARQSATFLEEQLKGLRTTLEQAQSRLSQFQQTKGIVVSDERMDQENARYNALMAQLAMAQAEQVETETRQRNTGAETSPDVLSSGAVQSLKSQLASAQTKLTEISSIVGRNHPSRLQLEAQIGELRQQLASETRRVAGGTSTVNRSSSQKVAGLQQLVDMQKKQVLAMRADRDQIAVYLRDVETAQRAYDAAATRLSTTNMEGQNNQANTRLLSPAVEPLEPSRPRTIVGILGSLFGALVAALAVAIGLELLNRRVRTPQDLLVTAGVPVIGVLRPANSKQPVFRRLLVAGPSPGNRLALAGPGMRP
ncbi:MAG TPA: chain length determinant protein EpsF [Caldimonas sp.]|nr:chain length determinant protein EpsF [Caldimonas sp.]HEX2542189.1 chain length determinant protein EpsF [Caldimonas sp.]